MKVASALLLIALLLPAQQVSATDSDCDKLTTAQKTGIVTSIRLGLVNGAGAIFFILTNDAEARKMTGWIGTTDNADTAIGKSQLDLLRYAMITHESISIMCDGKWAKTLVVENPSPKSN